MNMFWQPLGGAGKRAKWNLLEVLCPDGKRKLLESPYLAGIEPISLSGVEGRELKSRCLQLQLFITQLFLASLFPPKGKILVCRANSAGLLFIVTTMPENKRLAVKTSAWLVF